MQPASANPESEGLAGVGAEAGAEAGEGGKNRQVRGAHDRRRRTKTVARQGDTRSDALSATRRDT